MLALVTGLRPRQPLRRQYSVDGSESGGSTTKASNDLVTSKSLLCQVSPVFAAAFGGDFKEASEQVMAVHDFTCDDMGRFVKHAAFFYLE